MGHALKDGRGDLAPTTYLLFKEIVYLIVGFTINRELLRYRFHTAETDARIRVGR